jgi:hypothetical protein
MASNAKFQPGQSGNPATQFKPGNGYRWQPGQSGNPAGVAPSRVQFSESFNEVLLGPGDADEVANLLSEAVRKREPWAIRTLALLERLAREQINVEYVRPNRRAVKLANGRFVAAPQVASSGGESIPADRPPPSGVERSTRPRGTEEESSRQVSIEQRYEEFCLAKVEDHLRALPQAIRSQMFQATRSAIRREQPQLRGNELDEMAQWELVSRIRARLHLPSIEEFTAGAG